MGWVASDGSTSITVRSSGQQPYVQANVKAQKCPLLCQQYHKLLGFGTWPGDGSVLWIYSRADIAKWAALLGGEAVTLAEGVHLLAMPGAPFLQRRCLGKGMHAWVLNALQQAQVAGRPWGYRMACVDSQEWKKQPNGLHRPPTDTASRVTGSAGFDAEH